MASLPWFKWFPGDWRRKPQTGRLSLAARGAWREIIDLMHELDTYEISGTLEEIAHDIRTREVDLLQTCLDELREQRICDISVTDNGLVTVVSRRRKREDETRQNARKRQKRHRSKPTQKDLSRPSHTDVTLSDSDSTKVKVRENKKKVSDFEARFWEPFGKKVDRKRCLEKWARLSEEEKDLVEAHVPAYVRATPEKEYRKNPLTYLNGRTWEDEELPTRNRSNGQRTPAATLSASQRAGLSFEESLRLGAINTTERGDGGARSIEIVIPDEPGDAGGPDTTDRPRLGYRRMGGG